MTLRLYGDQLASIFGLFGFQAMCRALVMSLLKNFYF